MDTHHSLFMDLLHDALMLPGETLNGVICLICSATAGQFFATQRRRVDILYISVFISSVILELPENSEVVIAGLSLHQGISTKHGSP